ncbi:tRNA modification GTPase GTPBP3, mitochondrial isoform X2 [Aethina tumida]|uniref:tRNA modification GTPase GTPBP3, mitochondrial isoform X2 n=1 Tax=Aethina tumida TaxID=116153 RepID=UPI00214953AC|nr:tRNA modification GTPase GTPBP3, mitochondrial isoform X2 [Aethina tumida]
MVSSFTGEDSCELHVHGGLAVVNSVLTALGTLKDLRLAEPGEFTRRAFHNGKLDLTEVEGLADLLQAETEAQRKQAFLQTQGSLSKLYNKWKNILVRCVAHIEAHIDFEETETLDEGLINSVMTDVGTLKNEIQQHLCDGRKGETLRNGVKTVILGEPNAGKSSLLNILCQRPAAIVTPIEGTTRDILEVTLNIGGYPLVLADTAGLRSTTTDVVEKEGITRALQSFEVCDLVILVVAADKYELWKRHNNASFTDYLFEYVSSLKLDNLLDHKTKQFKKNCIVVMNKTDLVKNVELNNSFVNVSCQTEDGVVDLVEKITLELKNLCGEPSREHPSMNQMRHRQQLNEYLANLEMFFKYTGDLKEYNGDLVLMAESLRKALRSLGKLVGTVTTEQLLDVIFRDFCIGK